MNSSVFRDQTVALTLTVMQIMAGYGYPYPAAVAPVPPPPVFNGAAQLSTELKQVEQPLRPAQKH